MIAQRRSSPEPASSRFDFSAACVAEPRFAPPLRSSLRRWIEGQGIDGERAFPILVAVGEAVANAMEHAYRAAPGIDKGLVWLRAVREGSALAVEVEDAGCWPEKPSAANESAPPVACDERGRGLFLMRALMTTVDVRREERRTLVRLTFRIDDEDVRTAPAPGRPARLSLVNP